MAVDEEEEVEESPVEDISPPGSPVFVSEHTARNVALVQAREEPPNREEPRNPDDNAEV